MSKAQEQRMRSGEGVNLRNCGFGFLEGREADEEGEEGDGGHFFWKKITDEKVSCGEIGALK